jgi:hypothetical protein
VHKSSVLCLKNACCVDFLWIDAPPSKIGSCSQERLKVVTNVVVVFETRGELKNTLNLQTQQRGYGDQMSLLVRGKKAAGTTKSDQEGTIDAVNVASHSKTTCSTAASWFS